MGLLFKILMEVSGYPLKRSSAELKKIQQLNYKERIVFQKQKALEIFHFHLQNNVHYKDWIGGISIKDWSDIPILTKLDLQVSLDKRFSNGYHKKNTFINNTSGSSGTPFYFAKDKYAHAMTWALINERFSQHGIIIGESLQARFYGIPKTKLKYYKERVKDFFSKRVRFPVFDLSDEKLYEFQNRFAKRKFFYVNGYTSSLILFAKHLIMQGKTAKQLCPTLQVVLPTAEVCDETDRKILEEGFGVKVANEYGASELDLIAIDDVSGNWILNNETLFIEFLNDNNEEVQPGEEGRVIVTSLYNKAMPFIRYELGDIAIKSPIKSGNYDVLEKVIGRTNDIVKLPSGKQAAGLTFYYISKAIMQGKIEIKEFIIKQTKLNEFLFEYVADNNLTPQQEKDVQIALDEYLESGLTAIFLKKDSIERTKAGKLKHFYNLLEK